MPPDTQRETNGIDSLGLEFEAGDGALFSEALSVLVERKRRLTVWAVAGAALAAGVALLLPNTFTASAVIVVPQKEQSAASMLAGQLGPIAAAAGADLGLRNAADYYVGLLGSRTIADRLIQEFGLKALYRQKTDTDARLALKKHSRFLGGRDSLIRLEVEDVDPNRAALMANAYTAALDEMLKRMAAGEAGQRRVFLESRLAGEKTALAASEEGMKRVQRQTGVVDVSGQTQVSIASAAQLRAQITAEEVALERLELGATASNPEVVQRAAELDALRAQLGKLERNERGGSAIGASAIPQAALEYIRQLRELKYHEFLFELLSKQYEVARIDESKGAPALQVVDIAVPPDKKSGPHRTIITATGGFFAVLIGAMAALWRERRRLGA